MSKGNYHRCNARKLSPIKNLNYTTNEVKKLMVHVQNIDEVVFFRKCRRLIKIMKVEILNPIVRALVRFWDPDYRCFSFKNIDLCPTMEEYGMLIEFLDHLYKVSFPLKDDKVIIELSKLLKVPNLTKFLEKNASGL